MNIFTAHATKNRCYTTAQKMPNGKPDGIIVHSTGANNPNLKRYVDAPALVGKNIYGNHWNRANLSKCVHAFIGYDINKNIAIAKILPFTICAWGCGKGSKGSYNYEPAYLQFEICEDNLKNAEYFNAAFSAAIKFCADICKTYDIPVSKVISHKEAHAAGYASNHGDVDHWLKKHGKTMAWFRAQVEAAINGKSEAEFKPYIVKVTASALNIRKGAGTNYSVCGCIKDKGAYTIVAEASGKGATKWGKLKSGAGWISLDYTKKI